MTEITIDGKAMSVTEEQKEKILEILNIEKICFKQKYVQEIKDHFFIKDYQRGYRWTKIEIEDLLNDINSIEDDEQYCLQPLIIRKIDVNNEKYYKGLNCIVDKTDDMANNESKTFENDCIVYELIDGQQRLTTIWLILHCIQELLEIKDLGPKYDIYYSNCRPIDNAFIEQTKEIIKKWIINDLKKENVNAFLSKLTEKAYFIWYEFNGTNNGGEVFSAEEEFRNVNAGKIPLTNAELFKAMLLNDEIIKQSSGNIDLNKRDIYKMAFDWDDLEQKLSEPNFWNFISGKECEDSAHLDYLFELEAYLIQLKISNTSETSKTSESEPLKDFICSLSSSFDKFSFLTVRKYLEYLTCRDGGDKKLSIRFSDIRKEWENIKNLYNTLYKYFSDNELYNYLGFLVACDENKSQYKMVPNCIKELFEKNVENLQDVKNDVKNKIFTLLKNSVEENKFSLLLGDDTPNPDYYDNPNRKDIRNFLLFFNVWTTNKANERFPFYKYRNSTDESNKKLQWDIEHISARNLKKDIKKELENNAKDRGEYIKSLKEWMYGEIGDGDNFLKNDEKIATLWKRDDVKAMEELWENFVEYIDGEADNSIANLALLDRNTNRGYGNSLFLEKRKEIIDRDKNGWYIPIATKNVFLKYYSSSSETVTSIGWSEKDKEVYKKEILICITALKEFDTNNVGGTK